ncbi:MAG: ATP-dependent zinc metalloprotease FtsH [Chlamydiia bacterium]|nr:ATP-dependent zinc metalloprotease FtsH [Chlamydiia bacterium]
MNILAPIAILIALLILMYFFFIKPITSGISKIMPGGMKGKVLQKSDSTVTFQEVAGIDYVKEELEEIVSILKNPDKYKDIGAVVPKGVLCVGPPGTGKTLIAKAVAGEADCSFFSVSGSEFVEVFVGVGASRIRKMFADARKNAPCIIFIDEIDAIGGHRGSAGNSGGHSEREQTLNQLLVEMDGFDKNAGVIIMAATNRGDILDKALLRPGRFDRKVTLDLPSMEERKAIFNVHIKKVKTDENINVSSIAKSIPGAAGADIANLINEAAILAVKNNRSTVTNEDLYSARDKIMFGSERRGRKLKEKDKRITAYHEAGHAIVSLSLQDKDSDKVEKVTIIPRGSYLGATHFLPEDDKVHWTESEMKKKLAILLAGRAAEEKFIGDPTSGAAGDIISATSIARSYICSYGLDKELGMVSYNTNHHDFSGDCHKPSENTLQLIDSKIRQLVDDAKTEADRLVAKHSNAITALADRLVEEETLYRKDVENIFYKESIQPNLSEASGVTIESHQPQASPVDLEPKQSQESSIDLESKQPQESSVDPVE